MRTPIITCELDGKAQQSEVAARIIRGRIEKTLLGEIAVSGLPCDIRREGGQSPCNWRAIPCNILKERRVIPCNLSSQTYIKEVYDVTSCYLSVKIDMEAVRELHLELDIHKVCGGGGGGGGGRRHGC